MITTFIENIKAIEMVSTIAVCESIIGMIDKHELVQEYANNEELPDVIMESMLWFMESKNRERDKTPRNEIAQWMEKMGLWYTGDNPKKKKGCNRIYHFLQQHDFNPSDETYKTDIKLKDGTYKRIKLNIEINGHIRLTQKERFTIERWKKYYVKKNKNGNLQFDWYEIRRNDPSKDEVDLMNKLMFIGALHGGNNAFYEDEKDEIYLSIDTLRAKQSISQQMLKHEEGHAYDMQDNDKSKEDLAEINKIKADSTKHKKAASKIGMSSNDHDEKDIESYADIYSVKHAKIRTKNNSRRNISDKDLLVHFQKLDRLLSDTKMSTTIDDCISKIDNSIGNCDVVLEDTGKTGFFKNFVSLTSRVENIGKVVERINQKQKEIDMELSILGKTDDELMKLKKELESRIKLFENLSGFADMVDELEDQLDIIDDFLDGFKPADIDKRKEALNESLKRTKDMEKKYLKRFPNKPYFGKAGFEKALGEGRITLCISNKDIDEIVSKAKTKEEAEVMILNKIKPSVKRIREKLSDTKKRLEDIKKTDSKIKDTSTRVRYDFAKQYVKEYFTGMFSSDGHFYMEMNASDDSSTNDIIGWKYVKPLESDDLIHQFENSVNYNFPDTFISTVRKYNGGRPSKSLFDTDKSKERAVKSFLSFNENDSENIWDETEWLKSELGGKYVPFAIDNFGNLLAFSVGDDSIVFIDIETMSIEKTANSFIEFMNHLYDSASTEDVNGKTMSADEFIKYISSKNTDDDKVHRIEGIYNASLPEEVCSIISSGDEGIFLDTRIRLLSFSEILNAGKELDVDFKSNGIIPLFDCGDNDFIVYHYNDNTWSKFNIVDNSTFKKTDNLVDLI